MLVGSNSCYSSLRPEKKIRCPFDLPVPGPSDPSQTLGIIRAEHKGDPNGSTHPKIRFETRSNRQLLAASSGRELNLWNSDVGGCHPLRRGQRGSFRWTFPSKCVKVGIHIETVVPYVGQTMNGEKLETTSTQSIAQLQDVFGRQVQAEPTISHARVARKASSLRLAPSSPALCHEVEILPSGYVPCFRIQVRRRLCFGDFDIATCEHARGQTCHMPDSCIGWNAWMEATFEQYRLGLTMFWSWLRDEAY
jgi:hypothetical protein